MDIFLTNFSRDDPNQNEDKINKFKVFLKKFLSTQSLVNCQNKSNPSNELLVLEHDRWPSILRTTVDRIGEIKEKKIVFSAQKIYPGRLIIGERSKSISRCGGVITPTFIQPGLDAAALFKSVGVFCGKRGLS